MKNKKLMKNKNNANNYKSTIRYQCPCSDKTIEIDTSVFMNNYDSTFLDILINTECYKLNINDNYNDDNNNNYNGKIPDIFY